MTSLTCIVCPIGCRLSVSSAGAEACGAVAPQAAGTLTVTGNRCPRGAAYAQEEIRAPKRVVTATCAIDPASLPSGPDGYAVHRVPVKTSVPCPKEQIPALLRDMYALKVTLPVQSGDTILPGWRGTGIDVVAVRTLGL
jgi:CxxC motif-containing protein